MSKEFKRRNWTKHSRIGKGRKNKQTWRRAKGRHNKVREKRKGYPIKVMIGFRKEKQGRGLIKESKPVIVMNVKELGKIQKGEIAVIGKIGRKKKMEIVKIAKEKNIPVQNIEVKKAKKKSKNKIQEKKK